MTCCFLIGVNVSDVNDTSMFRVIYLKMDAAGFSETLISGYQTAWHHIPEGSNIGSQHSNLLKPIFYT
jgi:hypothetical protein